MDEDPHENQAEEVFQRLPDGRIGSAVIFPHDRATDPIRVRGDDAARSTGDGLPSSEAEEACVANRAEEPPVRPTAHRLRRILHDEDVVFVTQPRDPGHVRGHPEEVSRNDTQGLPRDRLLEAAIIEVEGRGVDVAYPDIQAGPDHRGRQ